ncbi:DegV family protein [Bacillus sp. V3B]|uniref:DegV family protein n=1 Tax=Bacillus sp. V3B TaxID=2804915 RepID=UPI0021088F03|nr:DegV family protein [Bacillus sp. V3B]MCQ6276341.1 DegV family protein [Bacillus sp. V3B]
MKKIAWVTDSTCYIEPEFARRHNIFVVPMGISFDSEMYKDRVDITEEEFYQKLTSSRNLPKSSQPAMGDLVTLYEELKKEYDLGIAIHVSSELSGTANASKQAADIADFPLELVDSKLISMPMSYMITKGQEMIDQGVSPAEVANKLRTMYGSNQLYVMVGSLEQLHKGGRVSALQMMMGSLLQIKPILTFQEGKLIPHEKVRSQKKALSYMVSRLKSDLEQGMHVKTVFILEGSAAQEALNVQEQIRSLSPNIEIVIGPLGSAIGVHAGAGTIALTWFRE